MAFTEWIWTIWPFVQATLKSIWLSVPNGIGTAVGAYFGTKHVVAKLERLTEGKKRKRK